VRCCHRSQRSPDALMSLAERPARLLTALFTRHVGTTRRARFLGICHGWLCQELADLGVQSLRTYIRPAYKVTTRYLSATRSPSRGTHRTSDRLVPRALYVIGKSRFM